ncbi:MAG: large conductance mechanosensitive channel protein MscL [Thermoleophilia bacterium]|nr:large conductance mechanosensitive channel protein MscL [Thermoleophilia bacterium]
MLKDFRDFIDRGNLLQLAVAFIMGVTFAAVVTSLVNDIIMPAVGLAVGDIDFSSLFAVIKEGNPPGPYNTIDQAKEAGAVTINYGIFINAILTFLIVAFILFLIMRAYMKTQKPAEVTTRDCPFCLSAIPLAAKRCPHCTSELPPVDSGA